MYNKSVSCFTVILNVNKIILSIKTLLFSFLLLFLCKTATAQIIISGTVYDSTKLYVVPGVIVKSTGGGSTLTDSLGVYHINTTVNDSISFYYNNKPTQKFPVRLISNYNDFDISLQVKVFEKFKLLKEVKIFSKSYKQDSAENRTTYAKIFGYEKPGIKSTMSPGTPPGLDINELINMFKFRRNKLNRVFQDRLLYEEEDKYVSYKFNSTLLKRVTGLTGERLDKYKMLYRPSYEFIVTATELEFYEYILHTADKFKKQVGIN